MEGVEGVGLSAGVVVREGSSGFSNSMAIAPQIWDDLWTEGVSEPREQQGTKRKRDK
jgi:hypothetical protein